MKKMGVVLLSCIGLFSSFLAAQEVSADHIIATKVQGTVRETRNTVQRRYILTGGPCVGKTSIIQGLQKRGYAVVYEAAADVIAQAQAAGNPEPWKEVDFDLRISDCIYQRQLDSLNNSASLVFFDRGPVDPLSYACYYDYSIHPTILSRVEEILEKPFYEATVFLIAPLIEELYENSVIRYENRETSERLGEYLARAYASLGFSVVKVPFGSIEERVQWILDYVQADKKTA